MEPMAKTVRMGVIGLGRAAAQMLPSLAGHPNVQLVAAADPNAEALARFATDFGGRTYATAEALCADPAVDAVYIASPHQFHVGNALAAANAGKHLIVEKPMALSLEECRAMTDAATRNGVVLVVGHSHGFDPSSLMMRELIRRGDVGPLRMISNINYNNFLYRPRRPEELDTARGGGIVYNQVPHMVDVVRTIHGGAVRSVHAVTGVWDAKRPTEGALTALLEFADGVPASLTYSGYDRFDSDEFYDWVGENGDPKRPNHGSARRAIEGLASQADEIRLRAARGFAGTGASTAAGPMYQPHFGFLIASCEDADLRPSPAGILIYDRSGVREERAPAPRAFPNKDGVIDEFYDAIVNGTPPLHDGAWGTETMAIALAMLQSARERRPILLEETTYADATR
jgi:phthalate 4,5-cis-dihydrodiol dehydrogenase